MRNSLQVSPKPWRWRWLSLSARPRSPEALSYPRLRRRSEITMWTIRARVIPGFVKISRKGSFPVSIFQSSYSLSVLDLSEASVVGFVMSHGSFYIYQYLTFYRSLQIYNSTMESGFPFWTYFLSNNNQKLPENPDNQSFSFPAFFFHQNSRPCGIPTFILHI